MSTPVQPPPYHAVYQDYSPFYSTLVGPDDFSCMLTAPENRMWVGDLMPVIQRLNEQAAEIERLQAIINDWDPADD